MTVQKVFKSGNSHVVTIPSHLMKKLNIQEGEKVILKESSTKDGFVVRKASSNSKKIDDLEKWFEKFTEENQEILDELAIR